jgi:hypothetical protein
MDVIDRLPCLPPGIENHSVAGIGDAFFNCHLPRMGDQVSEQVTVGRAQLSHVRMVIDRNDQYMNWGLWIYVPKGDCARIRRHYRRWYVAGGDTAEQAIRHGGILTSGTPARSWTYMVAMLRTRGAAPLVQSHAQLPALCCQGLVLRTCSRTTSGCGGCWKRLGSVVWRRDVATLANIRE